MQDKRESGVIPNGVTFGTEVLVMPSLIGSVFTHAGGTDTVRGFAPIPSKSALGIKTLSLL
ncbi:hypothetical protein ALT1000_310003 [Alteromonas macleodii]|jgi:hypothetical protein|tara:strand:+ start:2258 stop:2440 length:183 start_codon:yes stop_codon:yes gene_type:complete